MFYVNTHAGKTKTKENDKHCSLVTPGVTVPLLFVVLYLLVLCNPLHSNLGHSGIALRRSAKIHCDSLLYVTPTSFSISSIYPLLILG